MANKIDVLTGDPKKLVFKISMPLIIATIISWFTSSITNFLYGQFGGEYFAIQGLIGVVLSSVQSIVTCVICGAWIKTAVYYTNEKTGEERSFLATSVYAILIVETFLIIACLVAKGVLFKLFSIPEELYGKTDVFYTVGLLTYYFTSFGYFGTTVIIGVGSPKQLLIGNLISSCGSVIVATITLVLFKLEAVGAVLISPVCGVFVVLYTIFVLKRNKIKVWPKKNAFRIDFKLLGSILKTGLLMGGQNLLCQLGDVFVSMQSNKYLSLEFISLIAVTLPLYMLMAAFSNTIMAVIPPNYSAGKIDRVRKFMKIITVCILTCSAFCVIVYIALGNWYFSTIFEDANMIATGARYWRIFGLAMIPIAFIYLLRYFLDCVGYNKTAFCAGIAQSLGAILVAFVLIPHFGEAARMWNSFIVFVFADILLFVAYFVLRKRIFTPSRAKPEQSKTSS